MESLWDEIRRCLMDSICELNRLVDQLQLLIEKRPGEERSAESFKVVTGSVQRTGAAFGALNQAARIYSLSPAANPRTGKNINSASFVNEGDFWTIGWDRNTVRMKGSKGVRLLAVLADNPGREFHVLDLERYERKEDPGGGGGALGSSHAGPMLDNSARSSYRARLQDLREELEEAQSFNDLFRASKIREEIAILTDELSRAFGLNGRNRLATSDAERARVRVTLAVKSVIGRISKYNPPLGWHLASSVRTGFFCLYSPAPMAGIVTRGN